MLVQELDERQRQFCVEYLIDMNASRAAHAVGVTPSTACGWLKEPDFQEYITYLQAERSQRTKITADRVLKEIARIAFADPRNFHKIDSEGRVIFRPTDELDEDDAMAIAGIERTKAGVRVRAYSKLDALALLGKHLALFTDVVDTRMTFTQMPDVKIGLPDGTEPPKALTFDVGSAPNQVKTAN